MEQKQEHATRLGVDDTLDTDEMVSRMKEMVDHPDHYNSTKYECIDVMIDIFGKEKAKAFAHLNAFKYLWRSGKKGSEAEDLKKAIWYLQKEVELIEKN